MAAYYGQCRSLKTSSEAQNYGSRFVINAQSIFVDAIMGCISQQFRRFEVQTFSGGDENGYLSGFWIVKIGALFPNPFQLVIGKPFTGRHGGEEDFVDIL
jgi:hypothetical protein